MKCPNVHGEMRKVSCEHGRVKWICDVCGCTGEEDWFDTLSFEMKIVVLGIIFSLIAIIPFTCISVPICISCPSLIPFYFVFTAGMWLFSLFLMWLCSLPGG